MVVETSPTVALTKTLLSQGGGGVWPYSKGARYCRTWLVKKRHISAGPLEI